MDSPSYYLKFAAKALGGHRPGLFFAMLTLGLGLPMLGRLFSKQFPSQSWLEQLGQENPLHCSALLVGLAFGWVFWRSRRVPDAVSTNVQIIAELMDRANASKTQRALIWFSILRRFQETLDGQLGSRLQMKAIAEEAISEEMVQSEHSQTKEAS